MDHSLLLHHFVHLFGVSGSAIDWFATYSELLISIFKQSLNQSIHRFSENIQFECCCCCSLSSELIHGILHENRFVHNPCLSVCMSQCVCVCESVCMSLSVPGHLCLYQTAYLLTCNYTDQATKLYE